jgi:hypothetical protein
MTQGAAMEEKKLEFMDLSVDIKSLIASFVCYVLSRRTKNVPETTADYRRLFVLQT